MSHLCKVKMQWKHMDCAKTAAEALGFSWHKGGKVRYYHGDGPECEYTIEFDGKRSINKKYNAGLRRQEEAYEFLVDNSIQGAVVTDTERTGRLGGKTDQLVKDFRIEYGKALTKKIAKKNNWHYKVVGKVGNRLRVQLTT